MARKVIDIIYNLVRKRKTLTESGPGSKVISLPDDDSIKRGMEDVFERLRDGGYNVVSADKAIKSEADLARILEEINQAEIAAIKRKQDASEGLETIMYKLEKGIPLNPGDQAKVEGAGMKTTLDAFEGFKPKVIEGGKKESTVKNVAEAMFGPIGKKEGKEGIELLLKEGKITKGTAPKTTKKKPDVDPELQKSEDLKKEFKDFEERTEIKDLDDEPDGLAMGGIARAEMRGGGIMNFFKKLFGKKKTSSEEFKDYLKKMREESDRMNKEFYEGLKPGGELDQNIKKIKQGYTFPDEDQIKKQLKERMDKKKLERFDVEGRKPNAGGGRIGMVRGGGILKFLSENSPFQAYKKYLKSVKRRAQTEPEKLAPELGAVAAGGIFTNRRMKDILEQGNLEQKERFLNEYIEELNNDPFYKDRPELKDKMIEKFTERMFGEKKAMGGRIGFDNGGMTRRTFLKILGGLASIPIVGKLFKGAKPAAKVVDTIKQSSEVPSYFPKLVEKIITKGTDITSPAVTTLERQKVYKYKDYILTQNMDDGVITIDKSTEGGGMFRIGDEMEYESGIIKQERMEYKPPQIDVDPTKKKTIKYPAEYEEITVKPDFEGKMKDVDFGLDSYEEILEEVGESKIKKASGGLAYMMGE